MTYKIKAGAPFDSDNIFNIPPTDAGPFTTPGVVSIDGGYIPYKGTATYDPTKTYGPTDIIT